LDAWVRKKAGIATHKFPENKLVAERQLHLPVPIDVKSTHFSKPSVYEVRHWFHREVTRVAIVGNEKSGKTSLACQLARWALIKQKDGGLRRGYSLPVLLECGSRFQNNVSREQLLSAVAQQLAMLTDSQRLPEDRLVTELLGSGRILLILDNISGMSKDKKGELLQAVEAIPANLVIVTSQTEGALFTNFITIRVQPLIGQFADLIITTALPHSLRGALAGA